jgi:hypothetical protein
MGIFDEAIREHLELKRQHGAGDSELRELEDQAFGPPARPGEPAVAEESPALDSEAPTELAALQEVPEPADVPQLEEPPAAPGGDQVAIETEEHPPPEGVSEPEPLPDRGEEPSVEVEQPTELYDPEDAGLPAEEPAAPAEGEPLEDEFFSEQSLSDELDQALDAPDGEEPLPAEPVPDADEPLPPAEPEGEVAEQGEEGEDVLEETPEFLQDTPESDRLWFEQRPPKDFDFDD